MHHRYAKDGLAVITVALDDIHDQADPHAQKRVIAFLQKHKATFTNLLLDESTEFVQKQLRFIGAPCQYVFSRQGKWTQFTSDKSEIKHEEVEKLIVELLREK